MPSINPRYMQVPVFGLPVLQASDTVGLADSMVRSDMGAGGAWAVTTPPRATILAAIYSQDLILPQAPECVGMALLVAVSQPASTHHGHFVFS